jgi:hypothetical protein
VRKFLAATLHPKGQAELKEVRKRLDSWERAPSATPGTTFHYPAPGEHGSEAELARALKGLGGERYLPSIHPGPLRYVFADQATVMVSMARHSPPGPGFRAEMNDVEIGASSFGNFTLVALKMHLGEWGG